MSVRRFGTPLTDEQRAVRHLGTYGTTVLPPRGTGLKRISTARRAQLQYDWAQIFGGFILGGIITLMMVYGVIPALTEYGAAKIRKRY